MSAIVVDPVDGSTPQGGTGLCESVLDLNEALVAGDWLEAGLTSVTYVADLFATVGDPLGSLIAAGLGWVLEHTHPLCDWFEDLTGCADEVVAFAGTWENVGRAVSGAADRIGTAAVLDLHDMSGPGVMAYLGRSARTDQALRAVAASSTGVASALRVASDCVRAVHDLVRDALAQVVGSVIGYAAQLLVTGGAAAPVVAEQAASRTAALAARLLATITALVRSVSQLTTILVELGRLLLALVGELRSGHPPGAGV